MYNKTYCVKLIPYFALKVLIFNQLQLKIDSRFPPLSRPHWKEESQGFPTVYGMLMENFFTKNPLIRKLWDGCESLIDLVITIQSRVRWKWTNFQISLPDRLSNFRCKKWWMAKASQRKLYPNRTSKMKIDLKRKNYFLFYSAISKKSLVL